MLAEGQIDSKLVARRPTDESCGREGERRGEACGIPRAYHDNIVASVTYAIVFKRYTEETSYRWTRWRPGGEGGGREGGNDGEERRRSGR